MMKKYSNKLTFTVGYTTALLSINSFFNISMAQQPYYPVAQNYPPRQQQGYYAAPPSSVAPTQQPGYYPPNHYGAGAPSSVPPTQQPGHYPPNHYATGAPSSTPQAADQNTMLLSMMMTLMKQIEEESKKEMSSCCCCHDCKKHKSDQTAEKAAENAAEPTPQPTPQSNTPEPTPQPIPQSNTPEPTPQPTPQSNTPEPTPQPTPQSNTPEPMPQPRPQSNTPEPTPQPTPQSNTPGPTPQPTPQSNTPEPMPQPRPQSNTPENAAEKKSEKIPQSNTKKLSITYNDMSRPKLKKDMTAEQVTKALIDHLGPIRDNFKKKYEKKITNGGKEIVYLMDDRTMLSNLKNSKIPEAINAFLKENNSKNLTELLKAFFTETVSHIDWNAITLLGKELRNVINQSIKENLAIASGDKIDQLNQIIKNAAEQALIAVDKKFQPDDDGLLMGMPRFKVYIFTRGFKDKRDQAPQSNKPDKQSKMKLNDKKNIKNSNDLSQDKMSKKPTLFWVTYTDSSRPKLTADMKKEQINDAIKAHLKKELKKFNEKIEEINKEIEDSNKKENTNNVTITNNTEGSGKESVYLIDERTISKNLENGDIPRQITEAFKQSSQNDFTQKLTELLKKFFVETVSRVDWDVLPSLGTRLANVIDKSIQENLFIAHHDKTQTNVSNITRKDVNKIIKNASKEALIVIDKKFQKDDEALLMGMPRFKVYILAKGLLATDHDWTQQETGAHTKQKILEKQGLPLLGSKPNGAT